MPEGWEVATREPGGEVASPLGGAGPKEGVTDGYPQVAWLGRVGAQTGVLGVYPMVKDLTRSPRSPSAWRSEAA